MGNEIESQGTLTPVQLRYLKKLWRIHGAGLIGRRHNVALGLSIVLAVLLIVLSIASLVGEWSPLSIWFLAFFAGMSEFFVVMTLRYKRLWPAQARITDWKLLEEIVNAADKKSVS